MISVYIIRKEEHEGMLEKNCQVMFKYDAPYDLKDKFKLNNTTDFTPLIVLNHFLFFLLSI